MNSDQIQRILERVLREKFRGVFASDTIPPIKGPYPYGLVVNTDKEGLAGRHWQAIWVKDRNRLEFFDSFGEGPKGAIYEFIQQQQPTEFLKNGKKVQASYEISCGPFVIYYLIKKSRGESMPTIVKLLLNKKFVDAHVKLFVHALL